MHCAVLNVLQLQFERGPHGKPHLMPESAGAAAADVASQLQFNLSHTEALLGEQRCNTVKNMLVTLVSILCYWAAVSPPDWHIRRDVG
jgi:hypothetical protein